MAIYHAYDHFDKILARLKLEKSEDHEIARRILTGKLLAGDPRFSELTRDRKPDRPYNDIPLSEKDNEWLRDTQFGKFIQIESELLPKLRDEVRHRVEQRRRGLAEIFPSR
jgi:hypothetical protein